MTSAIPWGKSSGACQCIPFSHSSTSRMTSGISGAFHVCDLVLPHVLCADVVALCLCGIIRRKWRPSMAALETRTRTGHSRCLVLLCRLYDNIIDSVNAQPPTWTNIKRNVYVSKVRPERPDSDCKYSSVHSAVLTRHACMTCSLQTMGPEMTVDLHLYTHHDSPAGTCT